ncbi:hypothetical protein KDA14_06335, partial [Candidatus Saccharibacteria bacterium]|nr:hypothetical protein [Candidatus Saccharibacteria bacterium]
MITYPITRPITSRIASAIAGARVGGASNPLVWHAATPDSDGVMQAQLIGSGTPSFTVDDGLLLPDFEGIYRTTAEDTPPWHGARKVTNLLPYSDSLVGSLWTARGMTVATGYSDPLGGTSAIKLTENDTDASPAYYYNNLASLNLPLVCSV